MASLFSPFKSIPDLTLDKNPKFPVILDIVRNSDKAKKAEAMFELKAAPRLNKIKYFHFKLNEKLITGNWTLLFMRRCQCARS